MSLVILRIKYGGPYMSSQPLTDLDEILLLEAYTYVHKN
jgi:hypothetical protein